MSSPPRSYRVAPAHELARTSAFVEEVGVLTESRKIPRPPLLVEGAATEVIAPLLRASAEPMDVPAAREFIVREPVLIDQGIVLTADGFAVAETLYDQGPQANGAFSFDGNEVVLNQPPVELGESALLLKKKGQTNFGHWLVELLPRLFLHARTNAHPKVFVHAPAAGFEFIASMYRQSIELCCDGVEIIPIPSAATRVEAVRLITGVSKLNSYFSPLVRDMAGHMVHSVGQPGGSTKLFVSRSTEHGRGLVNASEVEHFFEDRGFRVVDPSRLSIREQVCMFAAAGEVIGIMGAAMTNSIFAPPPVYPGYLAPSYMFSINYPNTSPSPARFYLDMDAALERKGTRILAGPAASSRDVTPRDEFSIDVGLLRRWYLHWSRALE
jgi:capsular polysaccharide biosynthesis protein